MWNDLIFKPIISPIDDLIRMDHKSIEVSKGLFARVSDEVDVSKPLKRKLKFYFEGVVYECLLDYENITNIYFRCGRQSHKFESCALTFESSGIRIENFQEASRTDEYVGLKMEERTTSQDADWIEVRVRRLPTTSHNTGQNKGKPPKKDDSHLQGNGGGSTSSSTNVPADGANSG